MAMRHGRTVPRFAPAALALGLMTAAAGPSLAQTAAESLDACLDGAQLAPQRIGACTRAIETARDDATRAQAHLQRGVLHEMGGESETAAADYTESIRLDPSNPLGYFNRGRCCSTVTLSA